MYSNPIELSTVKNLVEIPNDIYLNPDIIYSVFTEDEDSYQKNQIFAIRRYYALLGSLKKKACTEPRYSPFIDSDNNDNSSTTPLNFYLDERVHPKRWNLYTFYALFNDIYQMECYHSIINNLERQTWLWRWLGLEHINYDSKICKEWISWIEYLWRKPFFHPFLSVGESQMKLLRETTNKDVPVIIRLSSTKPGMLTLSYLYKENAQKMQIKHLRLPIDNKGRILLYDNKIIIQCRTSEFENTLKTFLKNKLSIYKPHIQEKNNNVKQESKLSDYCIEYEMKP
jgi:hypothetical protein